MNIFGQSELQRDKHWELLLNINIAFFFKTRLLLSLVIPLLQIKTFNLSRVHLQVTINAYIINMVYEMGQK